MTGIRVIPVTPLGHGSDCALCATVDRWAANRKLRASAGRITTDGGAPASASAGLVRPADVREPSTRSSVPG